MPNTHRPRHQHEGMFAVTLLLCVCALKGASAFLGLGECELTKQDLLPCAMKKCDFDGDGRLSLIEARFIFEEVLTGASRWAAAKVSSPEMALDHCGDPDLGLVTSESFLNSDRCIEWCFEKRLFKNLVCDTLEDSGDATAEKFSAFLEKNGLANPVPQKDDPVADEF